VAGVITSSNDHPAAAPSGARSTSEPLGFPLLSPSASESQPHDLSELHVNRSGEAKQRETAARPLQRGKNSLGRVAEVVFEVATCQNTRFYLFARGKNARL